MILNILRIVYESLSLHTIGDNREIDVFLDTQSLMNGTSFQFQFVKKLQNSVVFVPIVSTDALDRMLLPDEESEVPDGWETKTSPEVLLFLLCTC